VVVRYIGLGEAMGAFDGIAERVVSFRDKGRGFSISAQNGTASARPKPLVQNPGLYPAHGVGQIREGVLSSGEKIIGALARAFRYRQTKT
jgi:hypothetical protein